MEAAEEGVVVVDVAEAEDASRTSAAIFPILMQAVCLKCLRLLM